MKMKVPIKEDLKSLGTVQIMMADLVFMFGVVAKNAEMMVSISSGIVYWGSAIIMISGAFSIVAVDYSHPRLVKSSLILNVISAVAAHVTVSVLFFDLMRMSAKTPSCTDPEECYPHNLFTVLSDNFRVLLILSILEVCMSIWTFELMWKARSSTEDRVSVSTFPSKPQKNYQARCPETMPNVGPVKRSTDQQSMITRSQRRTVKTPLPVIEVAPKSVGTVQIMIGAVIFIFGVVTKNIDIWKVSIYSGIIYWGSSIFVCSGALSIAAMDYSHPRLVKSSLILNLISAVAASGAVIVLFFDLVCMSAKTLSCTDPKEYYPLTLFAVLSGTFRVLLILSIHEVCMSIWTFALIWKSRRSTEASSGWVQMLALS